MQGSGQDLLGSGPTICSHQLSFSSTGVSFTQLLGFSLISRGSLEPHDLLFFGFFTGLPYPVSRHLEGHPLQGSTGDGGGGAASMAGFDLKNQKDLALSFTPKFASGGTFSKTVLREFS